MGEINDQQIQVQNNQIMQFAQQAKNMRDFLERFKVHLTEMCVEFESNVASTF